MYKEFFALNGSPFELSPDPSFLFVSTKSKDALASISYAISKRKGFVVMTGEVGTGKTLILRCLFELWEREQIPFVYFIGPQLSTMDFLRYITFELGINVAEPTKGNLLRALYGFLLSQFEKGLTTVLIIDEAHQIPRNVLEEIRLLANFETAQQKLLQILLVGQPELDTKLNSVELRSLKQRIAVRCQLEPLHSEDVRRYIEHRLELVGANSHATTIFPAETIKAIYRYSGGIPRLVNSICDQALIAAYRQTVHVVPVEVIDEVAFRFRLDPAPTFKQTQKPSSSPTHIENSIKELARQVSALSVPVVHVSHLDATSTHLNMGNGMPAQTVPPKPPEAFRADHFLRDGPLCRLRRLLEARPRLSFAICSAVLAVFALASGIVVGRLQKEEAPGLQVVSSRETVPARQTAAPIQPTAANFPTRFGSDSVELAEVEADAVPPRSTGKQGNLTPRSAVMRMSKPIAKSLHASTSTEPPLIITRSDLEPVKGVLDDSTLSPAAPKASGDSNLQPPRLLSSPPPIYPFPARSRNVQGQVVIDASVDEMGKVTDMKVISGSPLLTQAAMEALRSRRYEPARRNGQPIATKIQVSINFSLQ